MDFSGVGGDMSLGRPSGAGAVCVLVCVLLGSSVACAENGADAWLRYARLDPGLARKYKALPATVTVLGDSPVLASAKDELVRGVGGMLGKTLRVSSGAGPSIVLGTIAEIRRHEPAFKPPEELHGDGYELVWTRFGKGKSIVVTGETDRAVLYGTFALLSKIARGESLEGFHEVQQPSAPVRWVNEWDNLDGSIERGYAGRSIFFEDGRVRADLKRAAQYARLLASVGINGCTVNNVNADPHVLDAAFIPQLARIAAAFRPYGVQLGVAVNVSMPKVTGGLETFDPLSPEVAEWWRRKFDDVYGAIPDFGGVVVKADSEGQLGPSVYGRNAADAANVIARALKPHGGIVFYRAFVYNHHLDWNDPKADRARAAYDIFHPLDGKFDDNVVVQTKYGPIDFQVREPASPLFGGLEKTKQAIELEITQEYTGQQRHTVYLARLWKEILDFDMGVGSTEKNVRPTRTPVKKIIGGYVGVANVGLSTNWLANHLALANLYAFGRLAWNPNLGAREMVEEWTRLTFGDDPKVVETISALQMESWPAYESYTGVLGLQTLTNILGPHYGPGPESQERNGWGQWIRAEHDGVGMDRTMATGTGFVGQYWPQVQRIYEPLENTPDELLLFFHHVPYSYKLHSGKTVMQSIYDSHYEGAETTASFVGQWKSLRGRIDDERYEAVLAQFTYQAGHAIVWRDAIDDWFHRISGVGDERGRVGNHPGRIEAEAMELKGYKPIEVTPWETASGGRAVSCPEGLELCSAQTVFQGTAGKYELAVEYFDQRNGVSRFRVFINDRQVDTWAADMDLPSTEPNGDSSTRRTIKDVALKSGDVIRVEGVPDGGERAAIDYVELRPL